MRQKIRQALLWLFIVENPRDPWEVFGKIGLRLVVFLAPLLVIAVSARADEGWGVCAGMMLCGGVGFLFTTWYRWNVLEPRMTDEERESVRHFRRIRRFNVKADNERALEMARRRQDNQPRS